MSTKLKLSMDQLHVDSFEAQAPVHEERGTVHALLSLGCDTMYDGTCHGYGTCGIYPCKQIP